MCGIVGLFDPEHDLRRDALERFVVDATESLRHRGPDSHGVHIEAEAGVGLGHARLAILDLSPSGAQPMTSARDRYVVTFNGEIFNYREIRAELDAKGHRFRGGSDTEVMLAAFEEWGIAGSVKRFIGQFSFGLWDRQTRRLHLVRDRLGIKPMYYGWAGKALLFGSELRALRIHPKFSGTLDRAAIAELMRTAYVPEPLSIFEQIRKLEPGSILTVGRHDLTDPEKDVYWSLSEVARSGVEDALTAPTDDLIESTESFMTEAVRDRLVADVPVGAFLSGGYDSSTVVALMQEQSSDPVNTFSIGFEDPAYDEASHAKLVAEHLGTDHSELIVRPAEVQAVIPELPSLYDEPFADPSQLPTVLVSRFARTRVTVSLSGDGGDEVFGGYNRHKWAPRVWRGIGLSPAVFRRTLSRALRSVSADAWDRMFAAIGERLPRRDMPRLPGDKIHKLAQAFESDSPHDLYMSLVSLWHDPKALVVGLEEREMRMANNGGLALAEQLMLWDMGTYLPGDILTKVDRASMSVGLEARVPLLDHRLVEHAWRLPIDTKIRNGESKWILRQILYKRVPSELVDRPKMGFGIPIDQWLRGPLREWAHELLEPAKLRAEGYLDADLITPRWESHLAGQAQWHNQLWPVLMFQAWLEEQRSAR